MIRSATFAVCTILSACPATSSFADIVTINVLNEKNQGIQSRVVSAGTPPTLGDTNQDGSFSKELSCATAGLVVARPFDIASYFESTEEPCQPIMTLRVLSRQSPKGYATNFRIEKIMLPNGSPGVIAYKGLISTETTEIDKTNSITGCAVDIRRTVQQQLFKIDGFDWKPITYVTNVEVDASTLFYEYFELPKESVLLPARCDQSNSRIQMLKAGAVDKFSRDLASGAHSFSSSIGELRQQQVR